MKLDLEKLINNKEYRTVENLCYLCTGWSFYTEEPILEQADFMLNLDLEDFITKHLKLNDFFADTLTELHEQLFEMNYGESEVGNILYDLLFEQYKYKVLLEVLKYVETLDNSEDKKQYIIDSLLNRTKYTYNPSEEELYHHRKFLSYKLDELFETSLLEDIDSMKMQYK